MAEQANWYVAHTYSGYENKVATDLMTMVENRHLQDLICDVKVPTETRIEEVFDKRGNKTGEKEVQSKLYPGYVFIKMVMNDNTWYIVRNTRGCTGFVGPESKPEPLTEAEVARVATHFTTPAYAQLPAEDAAYAEQRAANPAFAAWARRNVIAHQQPGYAVVVLSLKDPKRAPGDITDAQLELVAELADAYSFGEVRATHEQNLVLADVKQSDLFAVWEKARAAGLATPNFGLLTDLICCPGGDFCALANAKSIPIANAIQARFDDLDHLYDIGDIELNISGCMNSCGHHHVGHIGILGVDKNGEEWYQVSLGGSQGNQTSLGKVIGRSFAAAEMPDVISKIIDVYLGQRQPGERFIETVRRTGLDPFKLGVYGEAAVTERKQNA